MTDQRCLPLVSAETYNKTLSSHISSNDYRIIKLLSPLHHHFANVLTVLSLHKGECVGLHLNNISKAQWSELTTSIHIRALRPHFNNNYWI